MPNTAFAQSSKNSFVKIIKSEKRIPLVYWDYK